MLCHDLSSYHPSNCCSFRWIFQFLILYEFPQFIQEDVYAKADCDWEPGKYNVVQDFWGHFFWIWRAEDWPIEKLSSLWSKDDNKVLAMSGLQECSHKTLCQKLSLFKGNLFFGPFWYYTRFIIVTGTSREPLLHPSLISCNLGQGSNYPLS